MHAGIDLSLMSLVLDPGTKSERNDNGQTVADREGTKLTCEFFAHQSVQFPPRKCVTQKHCFPKWVMVLSGYSKKRLEQSCNILRCIWGRFLFIQKKKTDLDRDRRVGGAGCFYFLCLFVCFF